MIYVTGRLQFLLSTQRNSKSCMCFSWAVWPFSKERVAVLGAWGQPPGEARGGCVVPGDGAAGCPGGCPAVHVTLRDDHWRSQNRSQIPTA